MLKLKQQAPNIQAYLASSEIIDSQHQSIIKQARQLAGHHSKDVEIAKNCFAWVRDQIKHSWDYQLNPVTCRASEVLYYQTGYCYAKAHLLAALLRANGIPTGLCYQRLSIDGKGGPYCLHGLNAMYLIDFGWYRIDARGNNQQVNAQFHPPNEKLAFKILHKSETDCVEIWANPLPEVLEALQNNKTILDVYRNLPDIN